MQLHCWEVQWRCRQQHTPCIWMGKLKCRWHRCCRCWKMTRRHMWKMAKACTMAWKIPHRQVCMTTFFMQRRNKMIWFSSTSMHIGFSWSRMWQMCGNWQNSFAVCWPKRKMQRSRLPIWHWVPKNRKHASWLWPQRETEHIRCDSAHPRIVWTRKNFVSSSRPCPVLYRYSRKSGAFL